MIPEVIVGGAAGFGASPNAAFAHTIFELRLPAAAGSAFAARLTDPVRYVPRGDAARLAASSLKRMT